MTIFKRILEVWMPRTLKNNDSLLNFFVGPRRSAQFGQKVRWSRWAPVIRLVRVRVVQVARWLGDQVVRWSGGQVVSLSGCQVVR